MKKNNHTAENKPHRDIPGHRPAETRSEYKALFPVHAVRTYINISNPNANNGT